MNQELSPEQSLDIINNAISQTRENLREHSYGFVFWGWLVTITSIVNYAFILFDFTEHLRFLWPVSMLGGIIYSIIYYRKRDSKRLYETHLDAHLSNIWRSIFIGFALAFFFSYKFNVSPTALMLAISGIGTLATGLSMKFKPLIIGALCLFIFAIASVYITGKENLLINAAGLMSGYVIPGHMLRKK